MPSAPVGELEPKWGTERRRSPARRSKLRRLDEEGDGVVSMISTLSAMAFAGTELLEIIALSTGVALWIGRIQNV